MTDLQVERAAEIMKILRLAGEPGMDLVAAMLNREPTYEEVRYASKWSQAFELAATEMSTIDAALEMAK